jgi:large subunit ribosomal protein L35Ae
MKGVIVSYRRGANTQTNNQMLVLPEDPKKSKELIGKMVVYKTKNGEIKGKVTSIHGVKGVLRVLFEKGMPGQSLRQAVTIQ